MRRSTTRLARLLVPAVAAAALVLPQVSPPAAAEEPVAGAQTAGDTLFPNVGNGGYDVQHYDIDLAWTPGAVLAPTLSDATIAATASIRATTTGPPLSSYSFDFEGPNLTVSSVTVNGQPATFTRAEDAMLIRHKLIVTPATPVNGEFTTVVTYAGTPSNHRDADMSLEGWNATADGATFLNQPVGAMTGFPNNNTPSDKATYTFDLDIPNTITNLTGSGDAAAASNGELVARVPNGADRTTWRWVQQRPMATELVLISIGKYDVLTSDVTLTDGRVIPEVSFVDSALSASNKATINTRRGQIQQITRNLETIYGPYPGGSTGVVVDTVPAGIGYALETQDRSFFPSTSSVAGNTLIHEIVHQWFGNHVAPRDWNEIWIAEGMATWGPVFHNNALAAAPLTTSPNSTHSTYFNTWNTTASTSSSWALPPGAKTSSATLYNNFSSYTRGAMMYEALKLSIGDPAFFAFLKQWQARYGGQSRGLADFRALAEELSGRDLQAFMSDWILEGDKPAWPQRYDLGITSQPATGATTVQPGDTVTYTLSAANQGRVPLSAAGGTPSVVSVDLADVLDDATVDVAALPAGLSLDGTTLTWTVPTTAAGTFVTGAATPTTAPTSTVSFPVTVKGTASSTSLTATARSATLGGFCAGFAATCASTVGVPVQPLTPTADPVVTGTPKVGAPLGVDTTGWAEGTTFTYQWSVGGTPVDGATGSTFTPRVADLGKTVTVAVTGSRTGYTPVTRTSAPSAPVGNGDPTAPTPTITGTPRVGSTLTAVPGAWTAGTTFTYQWSVDGTPVEGATASTFVLRPADVGKVVTVAVTGTAPGYDPATRTSAPTAPVTNGTTSPAPFPTVLGRPQVGEPLGVVLGTWQSGTQFTYQWRVNGEPVAGATGPTYTPVAGDLGKVVTVAVTGSQPGYDPVTRVSGDSAPVVAGELDATPTPTVAGTPRVGETLTATPGTWDEGTTLTYQWTADGQPVDGATAATFVPRAVHLGDVVRVAVTATKPGYAAATRTSEPTAPVAPGVIAAGTPAVSGTPQVGERLTVQRGTWPDGTLFDYQWLVDGAPVDGATGTTFVPRPADVGETVTVAVTGQRAGYADATATSEPTAPVARGELASTPMPAVTGTRQVGRTLTAAAGAWDAGTALAYQWTRDGEPIAGATATTYTLRPADARTVVRVEVTGSRPGYTSVTRTSAPAAPVALGQQAQPGRPQITGRPVVGQPLTVVLGGRPAGSTLRVRWYVAGQPVLRGGSGETFTPRPRDRGKRVAVEVVASRAGYEPVSRRSEPTARVR